MASLFALVAACTGGVHIAMDAMAGERERRSLVPLLLNPVSRAALVIGKWCATFVFSLGALLLTVGGFVAVPALRAPTAAPSQSWLWLWIALGLVPLAILGSAVHLLVSANSRSAKEAQSWLSMVTFVPMIVGMFMVFFPGWVGRWWFVAPVVGQQSLISRILAGQPVTAVEALSLAALTIAASIPVLMATTATLNRDALGAA
jgi:sodium transport system permease protein